MRLRSKLTIALLGVSLASAAAVGGIAHWMLMRDFSASLMDQSFDNFQSDVAGYLGVYGSWEAGNRSEPFPAYVRRVRGLPGPRPGGGDDGMREGPRRAGGIHPGPPGEGGLRDGPRRMDGMPPGPPGEGPRRSGPRDDDGPRPGPPGDERLRESASFVARDARPPFHFTLLETDGQVIQGFGSYVRGQTVPAAEREAARPIRVDGQVVALALPNGEPNLSERDRKYLRAMRQALLTGFVVAGSMAMLLGLLFGRRMSAALDSLTAAVRRLSADGELQRPVAIHSRDEIGDLARAFNRMGEEVVASHRKLRELSIRDPLTQLYNRRHFDEQAAQLYEQAVRYQHPLTVMVGDLDHFKRINDSFSHAVGDEVLRRVARLLREHGRKSDVVARLGGEEFAILFAHTGLDQAAAHCEALRALIEREPWHQVHPALKVTMSMGLNDSLALGSIGKMTEAADRALYAAKHAGRNRVMTGTAAAGAGHGPA